MRWSTIWLLAMVLALAPVAFAQDSPIQEPTDRRDITEGPAVENETVPPGDQYIPEENEAPAEESIIEDEPGWTYGLLVYGASFLIGGALIFVLFKQREPKR